MGVLTVASEITLNLLRPNSGKVIYAKQFDKASRKVVVNLVAGDSNWTIPQNVTMVVMYTKPDGKFGVYDTIEDDTTPAVTKIGTSKIELILTEQALAAAGNVFVEVSFYTQTEKLTALSFVVCVEKGVPDNTTLESDNYFNVLSQLIQGLLGTTIHPPQIDPVTLNWLTWDETSGGYVDSGVYARGEVGPQGEKGDTGVSFAELELISGTHAPGTTDTYAAITDDDRTVGTITVYNGQDGLGSPGSSTPQTDSGSGVVGTAQAYAREDHRHPLNVNDSVTPSNLGTPSPGSQSAYARADHVHKLPTPQEIGVNTMQQIFDLVYPIGCTYESRNSTSPASLFGGSWVRIKDRFTLSAGDSYSVGSTGGAATVALTVANLAAHTHGSKSLTGYFQTRRYGTGTGTGINILGSGIVSRTDATWTGSHANINASGTSMTNPTVDQVNINATHEHNSVGSGTAHNNMPPYVVFYKWERVG